MMRSIFSGVLAASLAALAVGAHAQVPVINGTPMDAVKPVTVAPPKLTQIPLGEMGSPTTENWETVPGDMIVRNTTQPALYVLPAKGKANGAAIILAPGGGFMVQSIGNEGLGVANYFTARGYTVFILKYRINPTPKDPSFLAEGMARMLAAAPKGGDRPMPPSPATPLAGADGLAAVAYVRGHAANYGVDPHRIGIVGFSAGGAVTMNVATGYAPASRPDFVGVIYGPPPERPVPADAPPIFAAVAADDPLLSGAATKTFQAWREAGKSAELHVYAKGGHGFGSRVQGTPSDLWLEEFATWLKFLGVTGSSKRPR
jgi:acetyl esterase/lipase